MPRCVAHPFVLSGVKPPHQVSRIVRGPPALCAEYITASDWSRNHLPQRVTYTSPSATLAMGVQG